MILFFSKKQCLEDDSIRCKNIVLLNYLTVDKVVNILLTQNDVPMYFKAQ